MERTTNEAEEAPMDNESTSSWSGAFERIGCGGLVLTFIAWLIGTVITKNPLWFRG